MKKILLIAPSFYSYRDSIALEIKRQGWDVKVFDERPSNNTLTKILLRLGLVRLLRKKINLHYSKIISELDSSDYSKVLFLNIEAVNADILSVMKKTSPKSEFILYMWDSIINKPNYPELIKFFNSSYTFDLEDSKSNDELSFLPLFYANEFKSTIDLSNCDYDLTFIGSGHSDRCKVVYNVYKKITSAELKPYFMVFFPSKLIYLKKVIRYGLTLVALKKQVTFESIGFDAASAILRNSKAVLDIGHSSQSGLTMRIIESIGMNQKIITTNESIKNYDFFDENMVRIIDRNNIDLPPKDFFDTEFSYNEEIRSKYSLEQWVYNVLN